MTTSTGVEYHPTHKIDHLDGPWWEYGCTYYLPGDPLEYTGTIQGDGHMFAEETLSDEGGYPVKP